MESFSITYSRTGTSLMPVESGQSATWPYQLRAWVEIGSVRQTRITSNRE